MKARLIAANAAFFPAAAGYAALALPASVFSMSGALDVLPGLASPAAHAHEMLFGFALAVVAGNQLGPVSPLRLAVLLGLWTLARAAFLVAPHGTASALANLAFAALLAALLAPRLLGAAKKLRNQALPLTLVAICVSAGASPLAPQATLGVAVLLFALLMLFMGGRIIAPAVAGQFYRQGAVLDARVQPRTEGGLIVSMALAVAAAALPTTVGLTPLSGAATAAAGLLAAVRLARWRLWALRGRPDLLCLAAGYAWLALGLLLYGAALAAGRGQTAALHVITVGGLGTLTLNVMATTSLLRARRDPARARIPIWGTALIGAATLARVSAGVDISAAQVVLGCAAVFWGAAFALLFGLLVRAKRNFRRSDPLNDA
jgi:uncharacterized protein involved in response to NO